jgi:guanine deaminase
MFTRLFNTSGQQYELLDWLYEVTFPMEARFSDVDFARRTYQLIVGRIINSGVLQCSSPLQISRF